MVDLAPVKSAASIHPASLPNEDREAQIFWQLRRKIARTLCWQQLRTARLRTMLIVVLSFLFWCGLFVLFHEGFGFIVEHVGGPGATYHAKTIRFIFHLFFASLNVMLVFSAGIILYTGLYRSPETRLLLTQPVRAERIVIYRFQEAVFFSCWGFFLLASPMMLAYGMVVDAGWHYYMLLLPLMLAFVYIPCALGTVFCLAIVAKIPRLRRFIVGGAALIFIGLATLSIWKTASSAQSTLFGSEWFQETLNRFRPTQQEWLPSSWLTNGLLEAARPSSIAFDAPNTYDAPIIESCLYLALLISNALVCHLLVVWTASHWFRQSFTGFFCRPQRRSFRRTSWLDRGAMFFLKPFPHQVQLLLVKDWRLLRRDPVQWSQFLIFLGLLALYFLNVERFNNPRGNVSFVAWINMVSFLNLAVVGLILSTFTTRFIYPMISLEGHCFWLLGLLPVRRETILWSKFLFASIGSWIPSSILVMMSDLLLGVSGWVVFVHQITCVFLCLGLASIAVGLGAMTPNFRETSPSKIAAGFGGTLNLVLSALYIMVIVVATALPCHFYLLAQNSAWQDVYLSAEDLQKWMIAGAITSLVVGLLATVLPMHRGLSAFRKLEFY